MRPQYLTYRRLCSGWVFVSKSQPRRTTYTIREVYLAKYPSNLIPGVYRDARNARTRLISGAAYDRPAGARFICHFGVFVS